MPLPFQFWRAALLPASFAGAGFHVEVGGLNTGRRIAEHEYPKRDMPFGEDLGRKARRWPVTGYCIGPDYLSARDALIAACEAQGPSALVHPSLGTFQVNCDTCNVSESRERGGYCTFEMLFVEAGQDPNASATDDTKSQVGTAGTVSDAASASSANAALGGAGGIGSDTVASQEAASARVQDSSLGLNGASGSLG